MPSDESLDLSSLGTCPLPQSRYEHILLGHGSGGQLTADLVQRLFLPGFGNEVLSALEDQATVSLGAGNLDKFVVGKNLDGTVLVDRNLSLMVVGGVANNLPSRDNGVQPVGTAPVEGSRMARISFPEAASQYRTPSQPCEMSVFPSGRNRTLLSPWPWRSRSTESPCMANRPCRRISPRCVMPIRRRQRAAGWCKALSVRSTVSIR